MKKFKKVIAMCLATVMALSVMCVGVSATGTEIINGEGQGVSSVPPTLVDDLTIQPYGSSPPASNATPHYLRNGAYSGSIEWMQSYMYSNKWVTTPNTSITLQADFSVYRTKDDAVNRYNSLPLNTNTNFRLIGNDGSVTSRKGISNLTGGEATFSVEPNVKYYLEIVPISGYYTAGDFELR